MAQDNTVPITIIIMIIINILFQDTVAHMSMALAEDKTGRHGLHLHGKARHHGLHGKAKHHELGNHEVLALIKVSSHSLKVAITSKFSNNM